MGQLVQPGLLQVVARDGNRRDAVLVCGLCDARASVSFHEGEATNRLDGGLLWLEHYSKCAGVDGSEPIGIRLMWDDGRETENLELDPNTRQLRRK